MANQKQLDILRHGVEVWNEWKVMNLGVRIDLSSANLTEALQPHLWRETRP